VPTSRAFDKLVNGNRQGELVALGAGKRPGPQKALAARFDSFATTIQNRIDADSGGPVTLNGSLNAQVQRALNQATRRGTMSPSPAYGSTAPASYGGYGGSQAASGVSSALAAGTVGGTAPGQGQSFASTSLPPDQRTLVSEATITQQDLLSSLDALQQLSAESSPDDIAAYKNVIRAEVTALVGEFARPDLPRPPRVRVLLGGLLGFAFPAGKDPGGNKPKAPPRTQGAQTGDLAALLFLLTRDRPDVTSAYLDEQQALREVVRADGVRLLELWSAFQFRVTPKPPPMWIGVDGRPKGIGGSAAVGKPPPSVVKTIKRIRPTTSYSQRLITTNLLLPGIAQDAEQVAGALDALGFGPGPQETIAIYGVASLVDNDLLVGNKTRPILQAKEAVPLAPPPPAPAPPGKGPTVKDLLDWAAQLSDASALDVIGQAGQLGINLLADQADELFFIITAILTKANANPPTVQQELYDPQVQLELRSLARDLSGLADQGT
jgi:hypothetical protein